MANIGLFGAIAVTFGVLENFLPTPLPGIRLGLANIPIMIMFYIGGVAPAFTVMLLKMTLVPILSGNIIFKLTLAVPSGTVAFLGMAVCFLMLTKYTTTITMGVIGAALHMLTQLWIINTLYIRGIFYTSIVGWYMLAALGTGILTGIITMSVLEKTKRLQM
jgi:heptaprenyl diphosphate synthase